MAQFRQQQASASTTATNINKEREKKKAERRAAQSSKPKPRQPSKSPAPPSLSGRGKVPLAKLVKDVISCLQEAEGQLTPPEIKEACGVDILQDPELLEVLRNHERLQVLGDSWAYKAKHKAKDKEELRKLLLRFPHGIQTLEVMDAYKGVLDDLKALREENHIIIIQCDLHNSSHDMIFPCDPKLRFSVDKDVQQLWDECLLDYDNLDAELKKAGIKASKRKEATAVDLTKKKERRKNRKHKVVTNLHMVEEAQAQG